VIDVHTLAGAYVLDALDDVERAAFHRHLDECESCALEVAEFAETAAQPSYASSAEPPPELREALLAQVAPTPQASQTPATRERRAWSWQELGWRRWTAVVAVAGALVVGAGGVGYVVQEQRVQQERERAAAAESRAADIEAVLTAPNAAVFRETASDSGTVTVILSRRLDEAVVVLATLPDPSADQAYELWLGTDGELVSAGVLAAGAGSSTTLVTSLGNADLIGVSLEPATGSPTGQPTEVVAAVPIT
jgi:anti-sigma-K factor RskA